MVSFAPPAVAGATNGTAQASPPSTEIVRAQSAPAPVSAEMPAELSAYIDEAALAGWGDEEDAVHGMLGMGRSTPTVAILYPTSPILDEHPELKGQLVPGQFVHTGTMEQKAELDLVMAYVVPQRTAFPKFKPGDDRPPICVSLDGERGEGSAEFDGSEPGTTILANDGVHSGTFDIEPGRACATCQWSQWTGPRGDRTKPACASSWRVIAYEAEWGPIVFTVRGTSVKPFKAFRDALASRSAGARAKLRLRVPSTLCVTWTMGIQPVDNYYVLAPRVDSIEPIAPDRLAEVVNSKQLLDAIRDLVRTRDAAAEEAVDVAAEGSTATGAASTSASAPPPSAQSTGPGGWGSTDPYAM